MIRKNGLVFCFFSLLVSFSLDAETVKFQHINTEHGLSSSDVTAIIQDQQGFIWIGTNNGLNRYDGYKFEVYKKMAGDSTSLVHNHIIKLFIDSQNRLWIGTVWGLSLYNPNQNSFTNFFIDKSDEYPISIKDVFEDSHQKLWVIFDAGHIFKYIDETQNFRYLYNTGLTVTASSIDDQDRLWFASLNKIYYFNEGDSVHIAIQYPSDIQKLLSITRIFSLYNQKDKLWIGTSNEGILTYDKQSNEFRRQVTGEGNIYFIQEDRTGNIWFGTNIGMRKLLKKSGTLFEYMHNIYDETSLSSTGAGCFYEDIQGNKWIGAKYGGINLITAKKAFTIYNHQSEIPLTRNNISAVSEDRNQRLWFGSFNTGIDVIDRKHGVKVRFDPDSRNPYSMGEGTVHTIFRDSDNHIWIGTYRNGLQKYEEETGRFISFQYNPSRPNGVYDNDVRSIAEDNDGHLWFATHGSGAYQFNPHTKQFIHYKSDSGNPDQSLGHNWLYKVLCDSKGQIWFGTVSGLSKKTPDGFLTFHHDPDNNRSLSNNYVYSLFEDSGSRLWIGTSEGLNLYHPEDSTFTRFTKQDGLKSDNIFSILEDAKGNLWLGTNDGLIRFNPETRSVRNYDIRDGLVSNEFFPNACCKTSAGEFFMGCVDGVTSFFPDSLKDNPYAPPVHLVDFKLFNQSVQITPTQEGILKKHISETDKIILKHDQNVFAFEFVALNYIAPENNHYAYMLEGFDKGWNYVKTKREAIYTNLDPGHYVFKVKAANNDGLWNEKGTSIQLSILPPFWSTFWFRMMVVLVFIMLGWGANEFRIQNMRSRNRQLEQKVAERTHGLKTANEELQKEMTERKRMESQIQDELKQKKILLRELYHRTKNNMQVISSMIRIQSRSIQDKQMQNLLNEIENKIMSMALVHQKLYESNDLSQINLKEYFKGIISLIQRIHAFSKSRVIFEVTGDDVNVTIDAAIPCGLIVNELITNALKYAFKNHEEGKIRLQLSLNSQKDLTIEVSDNGCGLPSGFDIKKDANLGLESVIALVEHQLQGEIQFKNINGLHCIFTFSEDMYKPHI